MTLLRSILEALPIAGALARGGRVVATNAAARERLGTIEGRPLEELALPPGWAMHARALEDGTSLCTFLPRDARLGSPSDSFRTADAARLLACRADDAISITDASSGLFVDVNEAWSEQYGYSREEAVGKLGPRDVSAEPEATASAVRSASDPIEHAPPIRWHRRRDGRTFPVELKCGAIELGGRKLVYACLRDVEERVRAEEALRRSEENCRTLIEHLPHAVFVHRDERILYVNGAARRLLGLSPDDPIVGTPVLDLVHPEDRALAAGRVHGKLYQGETVPPLEERLVRRDGSIVPVEVSGIPTIFDGRPAGLAIAQDITARRAMEAHLVVSDRLASVGRLAASIGHEINNPLMYVLGSLELLRNALEEAGLSELLERVDAAERGTLRVRDIVRDLRALSRSPEDDVGPSDLSRSLDACIEIAQVELRHRARLVREPIEPLWVRGSEARLGQVFLNLLVNAAQSIEEGSLDENEVRVRAFADGGDAVIEVADTGRGLPLGGEAQIFEPFFTTKRGAGMGLGLSICHSIVSGLGGSIEARRRAPRGSLFRVRLPRAEPPAEQRAPREPDAESGRGRRVLVVDDEGDILDVLRSWLGGYDVRCASSGREAIERYEREGPFDAVLCDLMMGDLTGMDVYARIAPSLGEGRVVLTTGGAYTDRARSFLAEHGIEPLHKPFRREDVLRAVARAVRGER